MRAPVLAATAFLLLAPAADARKVLPHHPLRACASISIDPASHHQIITVFTEQPDGKGFFNIIFFDGNYQGVRAYKGKLPCKHPSR